MDVNYFPSLPPVSLDVVWLMTSRFALSHLAPHDKSVNFTHARHRRFDKALTSDPIASLCCFCLPTLDCHYCDGQVASVQSWRCREGPKHTKKAEDKKKEAFIDFFFIAESVSAAYIRRNYLPPREVTLTRLRNGT